MRVVELKRDDGDRDGHDRKKDGAGHVSLHSKRVRVEVSPRTVSAAVPGSGAVLTGPAGVAAPPYESAPSICSGPMTKATATWSGSKVLFDIESESGHTVQIDEAPIFGDDAAMRPTEMLLGSLGGCTGLNAVLLLKKFKQPLRELEVEVVGEREEEWPKAFRKIDITFHCSWDGDIDG